MKTTLAKATDLLGGCMEKRGTIVPRFVSLSGSAMRVLHFRQAHSELTQDIAV